MIFAVGISSRSSSSRFGPSSAFKLVTPVTLPPGRLRLATSPVSTGSAPISKTIGNRRGRRLCRECRRSAAGRHNHGHLAANQFGRQRRQSIVLVFCPAIFDRHVLALDIACLLQTLAERRNGSRARSGDALPRKPITGIADCCARAANGQLPPRHQTMK